MLVSDQSLKLTSRVRIQSLLSVADKKNKNKKRLSIHQDNIVSRKIQTSEFPGLGPSSPLPTPMVAHIPTFLRNIG